MMCRIGCAACCVEISISSPIPGSPNGKLAGVRCIQLSADGRCQLFNHPTRPDICVSLKPSEEMCGQTDAHAYQYLAALEVATRPEFIDAESLATICPCRPT